MGREGVPDSAISRVEQFQGDMALGSHWWGQLKWRSEERVTGNDEVMDRATTGSERLTCGC